MVGLGGGESLPVLHHEEYDFPDALTPIGTQAAQAPLSFAAPAAQLPSCFLSGVWWLLCVGVELWLQIALTATGNAPPPLRCTDRGGSVHPN